MGYFWYTINGKQCGEFATLSDAHESAHRSDYRPGDIIEIRAYAQGVLISAYRATENPRWPLQSIPQLNETRHAESVGSLGGGT